MDTDEVEQFLGSSFAHHGFAFDEARDSIDYRDGFAGAVFYRAPDCKLQICWSSREGGMDFMLADVDAPNEFGLINSSRKWHFMLLLDESDDGLSTPSVGTDAATWWSWRKALFESHVEGARRALRRHPR